VDGASKGNPGDSGGGGCIRDRHGNVLVAFAYYYGYGNSMTAEIRALADGIRFAEHFGFHISIVHSDSMALVHSLKAGKCPSWYAYRWWRIAQVFIQRRNYLLHHVYREANQVADSLANYGGESSLKEEKILMGRKFKGCTWSKGVVAVKEVRFCHGSVDTPTTGVNTGFQTLRQNDEEKVKCVDTASSGVDTSPSSLRTQLTDLYCVSTQPQVVSTLDPVPRRPFCQFW
ncbi:hypothetical protein Taro_008377, partial [Colocasia esculenta]|nr:hypothetical protein [Colocasia esculenta]